MTRSNIQQERTRARIALIKEIYEPGMTALRIADALAMRTGERISRNVVIGIYDRNREEMAGYPLQHPGYHGKIMRPMIRRMMSEAERERRRLARIEAAKIRTAEKALAEAAEAECRREIERLRTIDPKDYDATALMKQLFELGPNECHWPLNDGGPFLFCGHKSDGVYCEHHRHRGIEKGTVSEQRATEDLRRRAA